MHSGPTAALRAPLIEDERPGVTFAGRLVIGEMVAGTVDTRRLGGLGPVVTGRVEGGLYVAPPGTPPRLMQLRRELAASICSASCVWVTPNSLRRRRSLRCQSDGGEASQALTSEDKILLPTSTSQGERHSWGKPSMAFASWT